MITLLGPKSEIYFTSVFGYHWIWHYKIVAELDIFICLFLIPMPFTFFWCLKTFCLSSLPWLLLLFWEIDLGSSIHDVLLCEWWFVSTHERRRTFLSNPFILPIYLFSISSWCLFSVLEFWLFISSLLDFILWHGIIFNAVHLSVMLPFCGSIAASFLG